MTPESLKQAANATKQMPLDEAYKILGSDSNAGIEEVMKVSLVHAYLASLRLLTDHAVCDIQPAD